MDALRRLREHANSARVRFSASKRCFVRERKKVRGLTRILAAICPVGIHDSTRCSQCLARKHAPIIRIGTTVSVRKRLRGTTLIPMASGSSLHCRQVNDRNHGIGVDNDIDAYVRNRSAFGKSRPDRCAAVVLTYIQSTLGWVPVASQVPLYSPSLGVATAIDLLCVDKETRTKLFLVEIKSTKTAVVRSRCYTTTTGASTGLLRGMPISRYSLHQLQLWAMEYTLRADCNIRVEKAVILRTNPRGVEEYPLHEWYVAHESKLVQRIVAAKRRR